MHASGPPATPVKVPPDRVLALSHWEISRGILSRKSRRNPCGDGSRDSNPGATERGSNGPAVISFCDIVACRSLKPKPYGLMPTRLAVELQMLSICDVTI